MITLGILLAFILSIKVVLTIEFKDEFLLSVRALGRTWYSIPKKPKKYKIGNYTKKKIAKRDRKAAIKAQKDEEKRLKKKALKEQKKKEKQQKKQQEQGQSGKSKLPPIPDTIDMFIKVIQVLFSGFFKRFHLHIDRLRISVGGKDAAQIALLYTAITNGIHPLLYFIEQNSNLHGSKAENIEISTNYLSDKIEADVRLRASMRVGGLLWSLLKAAIHFAIEWVKITVKNTEPDIGTSNSSKADQNADTKKKATQTSKTASGTKKVNNKSVI